MKTLWILLLNISFCTCLAQLQKDTLRYGEWYFEFQNYDKEITMLPNEFIEMTNQSIYWDPCLFDLQAIFNNKEKETLLLLKSFLRNKKFICLDSKKINPPQLDFLLTQKIINRYLRDSYFSEPEESMKESNDFWYLGRIDLHQNYTSHLILIRDKFNNTLVTNCSLFLLNIKEDKLLSITRVALYHTDFFQYLKPEKNNTFSYRGIYYSDMIYARRIDRWRNRDKEKVYAKFMFDDQGYVRVLWNKVEIFKYRIKEKNE